MEPNITCPYCRFRHPASITCEDAKRRADALAHERLVAEEKVRELEERIKALDGN